MEALFSSLCVSEVEVEKHLQDTSGKEGQPCTLSCQFSVPNVAAQWFKNGKQLEIKGRYSSEVKHKVQKLLIMDLKPEDQGRYTCRYQHLESSADLRVEGSYPEMVLQRHRCGGCLASLLTSFNQSDFETNLGQLDCPSFSSSWMCRALSSCSSWSFCTNVQRHFSLYFIDSNPSSQSS